MENQKKAYLYAFLAVAAWSTVASAFKISLKHLDFLQLLFFSSITSVLIFLVILLLQGKVKEITTVTKKELGYSAVLGLLNPFLYYVIIFKAYDLLPAQVAQTLNYTWGVVMALLSIPLLKQKITLKNILAMLLSFFGVMLIATRGSFTSFAGLNILGITLAVGSSFIWALFWIYNIKDKREEGIKLFWNFLFGSIYITIATLLFSEIKIPPLQGFLGGVYVGLFEMGITFFLWLKALQLSNTTAQVSNLIYLSPFLSLLFIHFLLGEKIFISTIVGLGFIIFGILVQKKTSTL